MITLFLATLLAALAAWIGNQWLYRRMGRGAIIALVPWWEEICKGLAIGLLGGRGALALHLLFGLVEFGYSALRGERFLGLAGFAIHGLVGGLTGLAAHPLSPGPAILLAGIIHTLANMAVLFLVLPTLGLVPKGTVDPSMGGRYNEQ